MHISLVRPPFPRPAAWRNALLLALFPSVSSGSLSLEAVQHPIPPWRAPRHAAPQAPGLDSLPPCPHSLSQACSLCSLLSIFTYKGGDPGGRRLLHLQNPKFPSSWSCDSRSRLSPSWSQLCLNVVPSFLLPLSFPLSSAVYYLNLPVGLTSCKYSQ